MQIGNVKGVQKIDEIVAFQPLQCQGNDHQFLNRGIKSLANEKGCSEWGSAVWSYVVYIFQGIASAFRKICCCCSKAGVDEAAHQLETLRQLRNDFAELRQFFIEKRNEDPSIPKRAFKAEWTAKFDSLPEQMRTMLVKKDLEANARHKLGDRAPIREIKDWVEKAYRQNDLGIRENSLRYIRDLELLPDGRGGQLDPTTDREVPTKLQQIIQELDQEIAALEPQEE